MIEQSAIQVINPVQWHAANAGYRVWKDKVANRMSLWGGGVNSQQTLPLGSIQEIQEEVKEVVTVLSQQGGYIFNNIHNILAEIEPEKVIAMYRTVDEL